MKELISKPLKNIKNIYDMITNLMTLCKTTKEGFENKLGQFANKLHWPWVMCVSVSPSLALRSLHLVSEVSPLKVAEFA